MFCVSTNTSISQPRIHTWNCPLLCINIPFIIRSINFSHISHLQYADTMMTHYIVQCFCFTRLQPTAAAAAMTLALWTLLNILLATSIILHNTLSTALINAHNNKFQKGLYSHVYNENLCRRRCCGCAAKEIILSRATQHPRTYLFLWNKHVVQATCCY